MVERRSLSAEDTLLFNFLVETAKALAREMVRADPRTRIHLRHIFQNTIPGLRALVETDPAVVAKLDEVAGTIKKMAWP